MYRTWGKVRFGSCRTPYGVRGLKLLRWKRVDISSASHSVWSAWIEIFSPPWLVKGRSSRTPYGVRGLKFRGAFTVRLVKGRTPYGVRGLKSKSFISHSNEFIVALRMKCVD